MRRRLKAARTGPHGPITAGLALGHPRLNMYAVSEINNCELAPYDGRPHVADGGVGDGDAGVGRREGALERGGDPQGLGAQLRRVPHYKLGWDDMRHQIDRDTAGQKREKEQLL